MDIMLGALVVIGLMAWYAYATVASFGNWRDNEWHKGEDKWQRDREKWYKGKEK